MAWRISRKPPLIYWMIAGSYKIFGVHDWAARIPVALSAVALCWLTAAFGSLGLRQTRRILRGPVHGHVHRPVSVHAHPDSRRDADLHHRAGACGHFCGCSMKRNAHPRAWALRLAASLGVGLLLKSLIGVVFPAGAAVDLSLVTRQLFSAATWKRLHPVQRHADHPADCRALAHPGHAAQSAVFRLHHAQRARAVSRLPVVFLHQRAASALPESALSARLQHCAAPLFLAVPPGLAVSLERLFSGGRRSFPIAPWTAPGRTRLLALCWIGFVLVFFTFSTTQEYYSMPCYPALALLLGSAMAHGGPDGAKRNARADRHLRLRGIRGHRHPGRCAACPDAGRYLQCAQPASQLPTSSRSATWKT